MSETATRSDVLIIGGGLHGLSSALQLLRAGRRVTILEENWSGRHASGASAAGVRTLFRPIPELPVALEARDMWNDIRSLVGDDCGYHDHGQIRVAETAEELGKLEARVDALHRAGYDHEELIGPTELRRLVPDLAPHCTGAILVRGEGAADPHRTLRSFRAAVLEAGGDLHEGSGVTGATRVGADWEIEAGGQRFRAPVIVNAAGAWAGRIAAMLGEDIPLGVKASMMIVTERVRPFVKPVISTVGRTLSFKQSSQGTLVIGGGLQGRADVGAQKSWVDFHRLSAGAQAAVDLFPGVGSFRIVRTWAGIEATTKDHQPVIGASRVLPGLFHVFGFSGHGFQLVPVTGLIIRDLVTTGRTDRQITGFAPERLREARPAA